MNDSNLSQLVLKDAVNNIKNQFMVFAKERILVEGFIEEQENVFTMFFTNTSIGISLSNDYLCMSIKKENENKQNNIGIIRSNLIATEEDFNLKFDNLLEELKLKF